MHCASDVFCAAELHYCCIIVLHSNLLVLLQTCRVAAALRNRREPPPTLPQNPSPYSWAAPRGQRKAGTGASPRARIQRSTCAPRSAARWPPSRRRLALPPLAPSSTSRWEWLFTSRRPFTSVALHFLVSFHASRPCRAASRSCAAKDRLLYVSSACIAAQAAAVCRVFNIPLHSLFAR